MSTTTKKPLIFQRDSVYSYAKDRYAPEYWLFFSNPNKPNEKRCRSVIAHESEHLTVYQYFETWNQKNVRAYWKMKDERNLNKNALDFEAITKSCKYISTEDFTIALKRCLMNFPIPEKQSDDDFYQIGNWYRSPVPDGEFPNEIEVFVTPSVMYSESTTILYLRMRTSKNFFSDTPQTQIDPAIYHFEHSELIRHIENLQQKFGLVNTS